MDTDPPPRADDRRRPPDGSTIHLRPIRPDDKHRLLAMWGRTSAESRRMRFHGLFNLDASNIGRFTDLDPGRSSRSSPPAAGASASRSSASPATSVTPTPRTTPSSPRSSRTPTRAAVSARC
jgi:hypothetical protein